MRYIHFKFRKKSCGDCENSPESILCGLCVGGGGVGGVEGCWYS